MSERPKNPESGESENIYERFRELQPHREYIGDLKESDILGVGTKAVVVRSPKHNEAIKVPLFSGQWESWENECRLHDAFRSALLIGQSEGAVSRNVRIPRIKFVLSQEVQRFEMEWVHGQSLLTRKLIQEYAGLGSKDPDELIQLTDYQVWKYLQEECHLGEEHWIQAQQLPTMDLLKEHAPHRYDEVRGTVGYLAGKGLEHPDFHPGNLMLNNEGLCYIIDIGPRTKKSLDTTDPELPPVLWPASKKS